MKQNETGLQRETKNIPNFPISSPFDAAYRNSSSQSPVVPHSHNAAELYFTLTDLPDALLNDIVCEIPAGTLVIIPPFCIHQLYHEAGKVYERYILSIDTQWLDQVFYENTEIFSYLKQNDRPLFLTPDAVQKEELVMYLNRLLAFGGDCDPEAMACFFHVLSILNRMADSLPSKQYRNIPVSETKKRVNEVTTYIRDHIYENLTVADVAAHFYMNPDYLSRLFKQHVHLAVSSYITLQKMSAAQMLLRKGLTVTETQEKLGYSSYAYFFRCFCKNIGISPSRYRERYNTSSGNEP